MRASRRARPSSRATNAFSPGFSAEMRAKWASTNSTGETFFWRTCSAMAPAERKFISLMEINQRRTASLAGWESGYFGVIAFYEKVIKVKADVAAYLS